MKNLTNAMIYWKPNSADVRLVCWPLSEDPDSLLVSLDMFYRSTGACYLWMRKESFEGRRTNAFITALHMIVRDKCDPMAVHQALMGLEEYVSGCADDLKEMK